MEDEQEQGMQLEEKEEEGHQQPEVQKNDQAKDKEKPQQLKMLLDYGTQVNLPLLHNKFVFDVTSISATEKSTQVRSEKKVGKPKTAQANQVTQTYDNPNSLVFSYFSDRQFSSFFGVKREIANLLMMRAGSAMKDGKLLRREEKIYLMLAKLKLHVSFGVIAGFFGISESLAKAVFRDTLQIVYDNVKECLVWFDRETIKARMPAAFKDHFPETRVILDCTEIETEHPSELKQQVLMYSSYKARHTYKSLVGVAPSGEIMFISKGYGGRSTDTEITIDSGFLNLIEEGDVIMSDKGFPSIEAKVSEKGGILVMPPFKKGSRQFSVKETRDGYHCASVRVHVERAIRRLKTFKCMKFVPHSMIPHIDKICVVVAFITNLFPGLIACEDDEEELSNMAEDLSLESLLNYLFMNKTLPFFR